MGDSPIEVSINPRDVRTLAQSVLDRDGYDVSPEAARAVCSLLIAMLDEHEGNGRHIHFMRHVKE